MAYNKILAEPMFTLPTLVQEFKTSHFTPNYRFAFLSVTEKYDSTFRVKNGKAV